MIAQASPGHPTQQPGHLIADGLFGTIGLLCLAASRRMPDGRPGGSLLGDITAALRALRADRR